MNDHATPIPTPKVSFEYARSWLLIAANDLDLYEPGFASRADVVILDLEDGVAAPDKPNSRSHVAERLRTGHRAWVRINDAESTFWSDDLAELGDMPGLAGVVLAKTEHGDQVDATAARLPRALPIVALIESAAGLEAAADIAARTATSRLAFGSGDFRRDTGISDDPLTMLYPRCRLTVASRAAGLPGPIDGPTVSRDLEALETETGHAAAAGMTGRLCLRPEQTGVVDRLLSPSRAEVDWAREFLDQHTQDPTPVRDGSHLPRLARATKLVELARIYT
ncbi:CoA ester lyase [Nocardia donostiensis]|uniref:HpcH/HpaI aldolase/citrate lyase family protein n=1 Tax=Nocardia donostiensis TaxID=1538463 RepID=UPI0009D9D72B|nr:aldolase/citrate lyase family protein [Nocardia donostiensis]OQS12787.1 CoA ester lyase [Nocardia donostiensis]